MIEIDVEIETDDARYLRRKRKTKQSRDINLVSMNLSILHKAVSIS